MKKKKMSTETQSDQHDAYREVEMQGHKVPINSRALDSYVQQGMLDDVIRGWDSKGPIREKASIVRAARMDQMTLSHKAVAKGANLRKGKEGDEGNAQPSSPVPAWPRYK